MLIAIIEYLLAEWNRWGFLLLEYDPMRDCPSKPIIDHFVGKVSFLVYLLNVFFFGNYSFLLINLELFPKTSLGTS